MTVLDFRSLVWNLCKTEGTPYLKFTDTAALTDLCQEQLNVYASRTQCLQSDHVDFTPVVGQSTYNTFTIPQGYGETTIPSEFSAALCFVRQVYVNGAPLKILGDEKGRPGESSEVLVSERFPNYLSASNAQPVAWWQAPPNQIRFNCPFDQVYSDCFVSGRLYHSPLLSDNQILDLAPEDIEPAAELASLRLLRPFSREKAETLMVILDKKIEKRFGECGEKMSGPAKRGTSEPRARVSLR